MTKKKQARAPVLTVTTKAQVADIVEELDGVAKLLSARADAVCSSDDSHKDTALYERLTRVTTHKINRLRTLDASDAAALLNAVSGSGPSVSSKARRGNPSRSPRPVAGNRIHVEL